MPESTTEKVSSFLWDRIADFFTAHWTDLFLMFATSGGSNAKTVVSQLFKDKVYDKTTEKGAKLWQPLDNQDIPQPILDAIKEAKEDPGIINSFWLGLLNVVYHAGYLFSIVPAIYGAESLEANKKYTPSAMDLGTLGNLFYRYPDLKNYVIEKAQENGYNKEDVNNIFLGMESVLNVNEIRSLFYRGKMSSIEVDKKLSGLGYSTENATALKELFPLIPGVSDLVLMAVREAFSPEIVQAYGLYEDLPPDFVEHAKTIGLNETWSKAYWAAHWQLPSLTDGFEMFHRDIIDRGELETLLRTKDIMPYWRERLTQIAYNNYTRVDVRRMHKLGILDDEQVFRSYKDLGYNDEKAQNMTTFTIKYNQQDNNSASKEDIIDSYKQKLLSESESSEYLKLLDYDENTIGYFLAKADFEVLKKEQDSKVKNIVRNYEKGISDPQKIQTELSVIGLQAQEIDTIVKQADINRLNKDKTFPVGSLKKLFREGYINEYEFRKELSVRGYSDKYVDWFVIIEKEKL